MESETKGNASAGIEYCDGQQYEADILRLVQEASDLRSLSTVAFERYGDWPVRYHLSPERSNLLRPFDLTGLDVLEIGAGMGAVSRFIAESAGTLTVVEGTARRFEVLKERLRDLENWTGVVGNIEQVELGRQFDVVCLIGVLEYAELYLSKGEEGDSPYHTLLKRARSFLKPGGVLVLAIENRLGLKYWNGVAEDHTGLLFDGISGYPSFKSTPRTFSRRKLNRLLADVGLGCVDEYFPFPDYKLVSTVLTKEMTEEFPRLAAEMACAAPFPANGAPKCTNFSEPLVYESLAVDGLFGEFANSFLFLATDDGASGVREKLRSGRPGEAKRALGWHFSRNRKMPTITTFLRDAAGGGLVARKGPIQPEEGASTPFEADGVSLIGKVPFEEPVLADPQLRTLLARDLYFGNWDRFLGGMKAFFTWSLAEWKLAEDGSQLKGEAVDALFTNAVALPHDPAGIPTKFRLFDLEWKLSTPLPASAFVLRNVWALNFLEDLLLGTAPSRSFADLYELFCRELGLTPQLEKDLAQEAALQRAVTHSPSAEIYKATLKGFFQRPFAELKPPRDPKEEFLVRSKDLDTLILKKEHREMKQENEILHDTTQSLRKDVASLTQHIEELRGYINGLNGLLNTRRHRVAEGLNRRIKKLPLVHTLLKRSLVP